MKAKLMTNIVVGFLALIMLVSFASALTLNVNPSSVVLTNSSNTATLNITADGLFDMTTPADVSLNDSDGDALTIRLTPTTPLNGVSYATFDVSAINVDSELDFGVYSATIIFNGINSSNSSITNSVSALVSYEKKFYEGSNPGELRITNFDLKTVKGFGDDENYWYPFDDVDVEFDVDNNGDWDVQDIEIEACFYDVDAQECILDEGDMDISDDKFDLDKGDDITVTLSFNVDTDEMDVDSDNYRIYVRAIGEIDDNDAGVNDGDETGTSNYENIDVSVDNDFVIIHNLEFQSTARCGETIRFDAEVWNIGDDDQDDVRVNIYSRDLGINEDILMGDIDAFDESDSPMSFLFTVPSDAEEGTYGIEFDVLDEDLDIFENSEDDTASFVFPFTIEGSCTPAKEVTVSASLESEAVAGEDLVIAVSITNSKDDESTFSLNAAGFASWANSVDLSGSQVTLDGGETQTILFTFDVKDDASGEQTFNIEILSNSELVANQPVSVVIENSGFFSGITGGVIGENPYLWGIGLINLILIIVIVVVAIRIAKK